MAGGHAAAFPDEIVGRRAGGHRDHARLLDVSGDRIGADALGAVLALFGEPRRALLDDLGDPVERLDIVDEGRFAEDAVLRDVGRAMPGQAALALDALDHRAFFAADISAGAAAHVHLGMLGEAGLLELGDLLVEDLQNRRILVAHIDEDFRGLHGPGGDEHAFQELVRPALEVVAVLERARLALVAIDGHQPRALLGANKRPLAPGWEPGASEASQAPIRQLGNDLVDLELALEAGLQNLVAALFLVIVEALIVGHHWIVLARVDDLLDFGHRRVVDLA